MSNRVFKVVICGKYKNLNKITKIGYTFSTVNRYIPFVVLYKLKYKNE